MVVNATDSSGRKTGATEWRRYIWSFVSFGGGLLVYYILFKMLVDPLNPTTGALDALSYQFMWEGETPASREAFVASDLEARYRQAVPSVLMMLSFLAALLLAYGFILPRCGRYALAFGIVALPVGALIGYAEQYNNPIRLAVADCPPGAEIDFCPLDQAVIRGFDGSSFTAETLAHFRFLIDCNSVVGVAAVFLLGVCFFFIARSAGERELDPAHLLLRRRGLESVLTVAGLVLVFSVATTHGSYHLSSAMMEPEAGRHLAKLASAGSTYWGAVFTTVMFVAAVPAIVSILSDSINASRVALPEGTFGERHEWREKHGLGIKLTDTLAVAVTGFAPVLTAPSLDLIQAVLGID